MFEAESSSSSSSNVTYSKGCETPPTGPVLTVTIWTVVTCACSVFCASFTIISYLRLPRRNAKSYHFVLLLSLCDVSVALNQLITRCVDQFQNEEYRLPSIECTFRGWFLFSTASRIMWNCCIASFLLLAVFLNTKSPYNSNVLSLIFHASTWLVSIAITASILALPAPSSSTSSASISSIEGCLSPQDPYYLFIWGIFILVAVLINVVSYLVVIFKYWFTFRRCTRLHRSRPQIAVPIPFLISLYLLSFLICWSVNVVEVIKRIQIGGAPCYSETRTIIAAVLQNSLGIFDAMTYYITSKHLRSRYTFKQKLLLLLLAPFLLFPALLWKVLHPMLRCLLVYFSKDRGSFYIEEKDLLAKEEARPFNVLRKSIANSLFPPTLQTIYRSSENENHHHPRLIFNDNNNNDIDLNAESSQNTGSSPHDLFGERFDEDSLSSSPQINGDDDDLTDSSRSTLALVTDWVFL
eukprot:TRINITY_DN1603_c0_g6_i1.p1 TRINITY_DN1603_c0_g6~~TRINITY_DN1603_c0_g6_i1.p1  ORF type:complete len:466 (+),score=55.22 TRINITY_DN1603_c0_g6_i1:87-1484(+)